MGEDENTDGEEVMGGEEKAQTERREKIDRIKTVTERQRREGSSMDEKKDRRKKEQERKNKGERRGTQTRETCIWVGKG